MTRVLMELGLALTFLPWEGRPFRLAAWPALAEALVEATSVKPKSAGPCPSAVVWKLCCSL